MRRVDTNRLENLFSRKDKNAREILFLLNYIMNMLIFSQNNCKYRNIIKKLDMITTPAL